MPQLNTQTTVILADMHIGYWLSIVKSPYANKLRMGLMAAQIDQDGKQTMELERPVPFHYSLFNLEAHLLLNRYADPERWPYSDLQGIVWDNALRLLLQSIRGYPQDAPRYKAVLENLPEETLGLCERLRWCC